jgi:protein SCO1/2
MKQFNLKNSVLFLLLLGLNMSCVTQDMTSTEDGLPYYEPTDFTPKWFTAENPIPSNFHQIPAFALYNQLGEKVTENSVEGKLYVADFFFTSCPGICPKMTANMAILQKVFLHDDEILLLSHSVTPHLDSVSVLQQYAELNGVISGKWHLLTGNRNEIYKLGRNHYFVEEDLGLEKSTADFLHTENFLLIDQNRHIRGIYNGLNKAAIHQLIADINTLKRRPLLYDN